MRLFIVLILALVLKVVRMSECSPQHSSQQSAYCLISINALVTVPDIVLDRTPE